MNYLSYTLLAALGLSLVFGLLAPLSEHKAGEAFLVVSSFVVVGSVVAYWLRRDNERFAIPWSNWRLILMVLTPTSFFAFLWYFVKSRGIARGTVAFAGLIVISLACLAVIFAGAYASYALAS